MTDPKTVHADSLQNDDRALDEVMREVPRGALALAALAVGSLLVVWFLLYVLVFLPRGTVG